jgi:hypothetical protein
MLKPKSKSPPGTKAKPSASPKKANTKRKPHYDKDGKGKPTY